MEKKALFLVIFSFMQVKCTPVKSSDNFECLAPMGMENGDIKDTQISATSSFQTHSVGPHRARLNRHEEGGAWCPKSYVSKDGSEYLEIDLVKEARITGIVTQGRHANGMGQEYAEFFMLQYWRQGMDDFAVYTTSDGGVVLVANSDTNSAAKILLEDGGVTASKVRIIPYSQHLRTVCMRVELLGCQVQIQQIFEVIDDEDSENEIVEIDEERDDNTTATIPKQTIMDTKSLGVLAGILFTMTLLLLVVIFLLIRARNSNFTTLKKFPSLGSIVSVSDSVIMDYKTKGMYTMGTNKFSHHHQQQSAEPIYQEPSTISSTSSTCVCDYSSPISVIYTSPMVQVGSADIYSVYQTPSFMKDSFTDISYLEESSVDSSSTSSGTPRLPPLPTNFDSLMKSGHKNTHIYINHTEL